MNTRQNPSPASHQAIVCDRFGNTQLQSVETPSIQADELLMKLRWVGLCGTDLFKLANQTTTDGMVLGHELVGEVVSVGEEVENYKTGDRLVVPHHVSCGECPLCLRGSETLCDVFRENLLIPGGFSEYILLRPRAVQYAAQRCPDDLDDLSAIFLEPAACVLRGIEKIDLKRDSRIGILGGGSMGLLHLLVLKALEPEAQILIVDPKPDRRELALSLGASVAVAPGTEAKAKAQQLSNDLGLDAIFDTVGGATLLNSAFDMLRQGGSIVLFAHAKEGERANFDLNRAFKYEIKILSTYSGALKEQEKTFDLLTSGRLDPRPLVTHKFPLSEFDKGIELSRNLEALKVVYYPDP